MKYDSTSDTVAHISNVTYKLIKVVTELLNRAAIHDMSKLESPEKDAYDLYTPMLRHTEYDSPEYKEILAKMKPAIEHHYSVSRHHPEHFAEGINMMNLLDIIEMLIDWKAAGERHVDKPMDIFRSIDINAKRFNMEPQLVLILKNTAHYLWYE